jgi:hypothetical protein
MQCAKAGAAAQGRQSYCPHCGKVPQKSSRQNMLHACSKATERHMQGMPTGSSSCHVWCITWQQCSSPRMPHLTRVIRCKQAQTTDAKKQPHARCDSIRQYKRECMWVGTCTLVPMGLLCMLQMASHLGIPLHQLPPPAGCSSANSGGTQPCGVRIQHVDTG